MTKFCISKVVSAAALVALVADINAKTRDGYIADQTDIGDDVWLVRIECTQRDDADAVRAW